MRNALICAGVMLAVLLLWPLVFGGAGSAANAYPAPHPPRTVAMMIPPVASRQAVGVAPATGTGHSCRRHHDAAARSCAGAQCRQHAADDWDICEATGAWPD